jgi:asparagine synthase (glutamine-hydrolysing)
LEGGRQPLTNENGTICVCQNGEIFNYPELRWQILKKGHFYRTQCDTEVLVHMYEEYGINFVKQLNGMFAIALWDAKQKKGMLVRDRIGEKPLYYLLYDSCLYFASEIKALLALPFVRREINLEALHHFLSYKHVPCPMTIFKDIWMLRPAQYLVYQSGNYMTDNYWQLSYANNEFENSINEQEIVDELLRLLKQGIKRRLVSDVPIGFFLSGGVDSSLATAIASGMSEKPIKTFTLTYSSDVVSIGKEVDKVYARQIAKQYGTDHHEEMMEVNYFPDTFPKVISCFDQPFAAAVSTYFLARQLGRYGKIFLTGDGADELFGNYLSHRLARPINNYLNGGADLSPYQNDVPYLASLAEKEDWEWRAKLFVFIEEEKAKLYSPELMETMKQYNSTEHLKGYFEGLYNADPLNRMLGAEFRGIFPDQILEFADKLSMAHSLELRAAYLDHGFVEFVARIPGSWKIRNGVTKYILKKAAERYLPAEIIYRSKEGFMLPITEWFYWSLRDYVQDMLSEGNLSKHGFFNAGYVRQLIDEFYNRSYDYRRGNKLLSLISFQVWYNMYMGV